MTKNLKGRTGKMVDDTYVDRHAVYDATADAISRITPSHEIFRDARGFTYTSVRLCDLDRICDK